MSGKKRRSRFSREIRRTARRLKESCKNVKRAWSDAQHDFLLCGEY
jgi:hypothetical protein